MQNMQFFLEQAHGTTVTTLVTPGLGYMRGQNFVVLYICICVMTNTDVVFHKEDMEAVVRGQVQLLYSWTPLDHRGYRVLLKDPTGPI